MTKPPEITIGSRRIGPGRPVYLIAEMSANHNGDYEQAVRLIQAAAQSGADAVKLQTYTADTMTIDSPDELFQIGGGTIWDGRKLYDLYREAQTPWEWQPKLKQVAEGLGLDLFSTPFDETAVRFLEKMDVSAYKIASFELVDLPLIRAVARTGKPIIMSTGMASIEEIAEALEAARSVGATQLALLKCNSAYPAPPEEMNLKTIEDLAARFKVPIGLSDHTLGSACAIASVALGACIVEKHFTLDRNTAGPDSAFSIEPPQLADLVDSIRTVEKALGEPHYGPLAKEAASLNYRRSIFVVADIAAGQQFTEENVRIIRPGQGLAPKHYDQVLGRIAIEDISRGTPLAWSLVKD